MFQTIYSQIVLSAAVVVVIFVFLKGDEPERIGAASYALLVLATTMISDASADVSVPRWGVMGLETLLLLVFIGIAWQSRRTWPIWAAAFQSLVVTGHVLVVLNLRPPTNAWAAVVNMANYGLLGAMAIGTFWAWQERRAAGLER